VRGCFVTGTDTGAGKTVVAAAIVAALRARGERVAAFKPVVTGLDDPVDPDWPPDHELLATAAGIPADAVAPLRYGPAVSPHLAAELEERPIDPAELLAAARAAGEGADALVVEGIGGLLVPLTLGYAVRDFARDLALPVVIAARPGLGTINHSLLTVEAARAVGLAVAGVVLTPWPAQRDIVAWSNRLTIERLAGVEVSTLAQLERAEPAALAAAGAALPLDDWVGSDRAAI
jgi:dethiobiotin synthetase